MIPTAFEKVALGTDSFGLFRFVGCIPTSWCILWNLVYSF